MGNFQIKLPVAGESEKKTEEYLRRKIKAQGGIAYKFVSPARRSVPDRLCCMPGGTMFFVEVKSTGQKPTAGQVREMSRLVNLGFTCYVADSKADVDYILERCRQGKIQDDGNKMRGQT